MSAIPVWGHDPGLVDGGLVLLAADGASVLVAMHWHRLQRKSGDVWRVCVVTDGADKVSGPMAPVDSLHRVGRLACHLGWAAVGSTQLTRWGLVTEGLFIAPRGHRRIKGRRSNPESILALSYAAGCIDSQLMDQVRGDVLRPPWELWTRETLACTGGGKKVTARASQKAMERFTGLGALVDVEHVIDAVWMARHGWEAQHDEG